MSLMEAVIGWIAPSQCLICGTEGQALCMQCANTEIIPYGERCFDCGAVSAGSRTCEHCRASAPRYVWLTTNYEAAARELVKVYKFGHQRATAESIADLMIKTFGRYSNLDPKNYLIVPVPTATSRVRQRGFDQSLHLARLIARRLGTRYLNALTRIGQTRQVGAERTIRLKQLTGNYLVRYPNLVAAHNILLIDDVVTTGATIRTTTKVLRAAGASRVDALVFAKRL